MRACVARPSQQTRSGHDETWASLDDGSGGELSGGWVIAARDRRGGEHRPRDGRERDRQRARQSLPTPSFSTAEAGEQLLAFVSSDGPSGAGKQSATVSGAGLVWTLVKRANSRSGDAEIWTASGRRSLTKRPSPRPRPPSGYDQSLTVVSIEHSTGIGASVTGGAASGAPSVSLTSTGEASLVYADGNDWDRAAARTLGPNQTMLHQYLDTETGDTFWSQYTSAATVAAGASSRSTTPLPRRSVEHGRGRDPRQPAAPPPPLQAR